MQVVRGVLVFLLVACARLTVAGVQDSLWLGIWGDVEANWHHADFTQLPGVPNCCPDFQSGSGTGPAFGLFGQRNLPNNLQLALRAGYFSWSGTLQAVQHTTVNVSDIPTPADIEHTIEGGLGSIGIEPMLQWRHASGAILGIGLNAGIMVHHAFHQYETLQQPSTGTFENGLRVRNDTSGVIPQVSLFSAAAVGMLSYELPMNATRTLLLMPSVSYAFGFTRIVSGTAWRVDALRAGVALLYAPRPDEPVAQPRQPLPPPAESAPRVPVAADVHVDGEEVIHVTTSIATEAFALLPAIFFDANAARIPARYVRCDSPCARSFRESNLPNNALSMYHSVLNIIGRRMQDNPDATIVLTGSVDDKNAEHNALYLAHARADSVKDYLVTVWGIAASRIDVAARLLPAKPTNPASPDGDEENRRVTIASSSDALLQPVLHRRFEEVRVTPADIPFTLRTAPAERITSWRLEAETDGTRAAIAEGTGLLPHRVTWQVDSGALHLLRQAAPLNAVLTVVDDAHRTTESRCAIHVVHAHDSIESQRMSLLMFDFDRADIDDPSGQAIARFVAGAARDSATVRILGTTDRLGEPSHNVELSQARADHVLGALLRLWPDVHVEDVRGICMSQPAFDNALPEGRQYSRRVSIEVRSESTNH